MKKNSLLLVVMMLSFALILCACGEKEEKPVDENTVVENNEVENFEEEEYNYEPIPFKEEDLDKLVVSYNGGEARLGQKMADVLPVMGQEVRPAQSYTPCGGSDDAQNVVHYYDGLELEETSEGLFYHAKISAFDYPDSKAMIAGIKLGDSPETVKAMFATEPETDSEYTINYTFGNIALSFGLDFEGTGLVNYISMDDFSLGGI